jgi:putative transposase
MKRLSRQLSKKQHPKTKDDETKVSNNHRKASRKLARLHKRIADIRQDFTHKLTSCLCRHADYFGLEHLNVKGMMRNRRLAKHIADVAFYEFKRQLMYKSDHKIHEVDQFYPSSKTCSSCKLVKSDLKLSDRIYHCKHCGTELDRDYNAALNLFYELQSQIGQVLPEFTPADLSALSDDLLKNRLTTCKVDTGMQQKS